MGVHPQAGKTANPDQLTHIPRLITSYFTDQPDPSVREQRVAFGTSGHRGSSLHKSFNEQHILATTQAICLYREKEGITGPVFMGIDSHALSEPAQASAIEVLAANGVVIMIADNNDYTPTPAVSHAILVYNRGRSSGLADGIVITPSHNPPDDGGFKYNMTNGGPAESNVTGWIEAKANELLEDGLRQVKRMPLQKALKADTTHFYDYLDAYTGDLDQVIDMELLRSSGIEMGVDPLGGAGVRYWERIADRYKLNLTVVDKEVDHTFRFMSLDWDGKIRMDPSSRYAMQRLIQLKDRFPVAFACDTDHDRHGIVTRSSGLMQPNHYLAVAIDYLFQNRPNWGPDTGIGKTLVSSQMIDRVAAKLGRKLVEVPVGFKWFVDGLFDGSLGFGGEESAGASFLDLQGKVWSTDKDGLIAALLSGEITARTGKDPGEIYKGFTKEFGEPVYDRIDAPATPEQKDKLKKLSPDQITSSELAGDKIEAILTKAPGNGADIGGLKVTTANGWFAARPSGTENIYKIYAESFKGEAHLKQLQQEAQKVVDGVIG
ncbi:phosphoglucomutase (alpha-D-glucose-1,6-bisphosphate-dependent) [Flavilitoribacter nigricans]|uniref:Phosphoglucomutase, alpha-D-glucose phosphate-specific n=1 Tax=Flavilitoribacter nigricans (strain ATCC 23147 / DSM 23189 / NBRC 102662 / NCIMB 1420 / SS-2) TaxID=1122177 RepID=A0A2D0NJ94_FLAN2|nr:phosphoglucomutase (alpha-D-glucose-1,6-bisphosphate-dependent) [Flavilitoribacter nigricans]PHN08269.1 phosphoglucomutase, alpha-D-glucose phosphate-specific [Flavilitoribacter nigricans DSM 23189 = NBRC 102662]